MNSTRARLADQLVQVEQDLADLDDQVTAGEIDQATAGRLRETYEDEAARLQADLEVPDDGGVGQGRSRGRMIAGGVVLGVGTLVIVVAAVASLSGRTPGGNLTGGVASDVLVGEGVDLDEISNEEMEAVVAANPDVVAMRLALARRYFEAVDYGRALDHYMVILDGQGVESPEALANVGWMTAVSGRPDVGLSFVERALAIEPDYPQAYWYLGNIMVVLDDGIGAMEAFEVLLGYPDLPAEIETEAEAILADLRSRP